MGAADAILSKMTAAGDSPAAALARLVAEDGPAPVVEFDRAFYRPARAREAAERLRDRLDPTWRRMLWWRMRCRQPRQYSTALVRLEGDAAERADAIIRRAEA